MNGRHERYLVEGRMWCLLCGDRSPGLAESAPEPWTEERALRHYFQKGGRVNR